MKLKKVKNCSGCKGLYVSNGRTECTCGKDIHVVGRKETSLGELVEYAPRDNLCYKPRTYKEYFESCKLIRSEVTK